MLISHDVAIPSEEARDENVWQQLLPLCPQGHGLCD